MSLRPYKFLVVPVVQEVDDDGVVIQERQPEQPTHVFGVDGLMQFASTFEESLAAQSASMNGGNPNAR
jgi:hypothetical protein